MNEDSRPAPDEREPATPSAQSGAASAQAADPAAATDVRDRATALVRALRAEIGRAVVGQREAIDHVLVALLASGHVLLEGVPGLGKTLTVLALARTFGGTFSRIQFTPDLMPADVTGHSIYDASSGDFRLRRGPVFANLLLADEINRAPAKTQSALLEVMQEQQVSIEGRSLPLEPPFMVVATQNPIELEGTYPLPEAQLDRFLLKVSIDYPEAEDEIELVEKVLGRSKGDRLDVAAVNAVANVKTIVQLQNITASTVVDRRVVTYAVEIARACRTWAALRYGPGPRGALALIRAARAWALLQGRDFVLPDDVKQVSEPCLVHRVALSPELEIEGYSLSRVIADVVDSVEAPRL